MMRTLVRHIALALGGLLVSGPAHGDAGSTQMFREHVRQDIAPFASAIANTLESGLVFFMYDTIRNDSGQAWRAIRVQLLQVGPDGKSFIPSDTRDGLSFMSQEKNEVWTALVELRIDGVYQGLPGGSHTVKRDASANEVEFGFGERPVLPGETVELRLRMQNSEANPWRLQFVPVVLTDVRAWRIGSGAALMALGAAGLLLGRWRSSRSR